MHKKEIAVEISTQQKTVNLKIAKINIVITGLQSNASMLNIVWFIQNAYVGMMNPKKLDGVVPMDYRPFAEKPNHFVKKRRRKKRKKNLRHDT